MKAAGKSSEDLSCPRFFEEYIWRILNLMDIEQTSLSLNQDNLWVKKA